MLLTFPVRVNDKVGFNIQVRILAFHMGCFSRDLNSLQREDANADWG